MPAISVITPCYNDAEFVAEAIACVQQQDDVDLEHIIVNDGSEDGSRAILDAAQKQHSNLRVVHQANSGAATARNTALKLAEGDYIAFLDADDFWEPDALRTLYTEIQQEQSTIVYCGWQNLGISGGRGEPFVPPDYRDSNLVELLLGGNRWPIHAAMTRRAAIESVGGFNPALSSCMDYDLWLRLSPTSTVALVPKVLAYYRHHDGTQITKNRTVIAMNHWRAQTQFIAANPAAVAHLSKKRLRELTLGELLHRGYTAYWKRDLETARKLFRFVMRHAYGGFRDWRYMLPAWLPKVMHQRLIELRDTAEPAES